MYEDLFDDIEEEEEEHIPVGAVLLGVFSAILILSAISIDLVRSSSTVVFNSQMGTRVVIALIEEVAAELEATTTPKAAIEETVREIPPVSAYQAFEGAQRTLVLALVDVVRYLAAQQPTECVSESIHGPWDNVGWIGDEPGCDDPTPGVIKMFRAPIQGISGAGGGAAPSSGGGSEDSGGGDGGGDVGGGDIGGGDIGGGPPSGPPGGGAGPTF